MKYRDLFESHIDAPLSDQLLGSKSYYLKGREEYDGSFKFISWNWAAFFGTIYWLVYRRLYKVALVMIGINLSFRLLPFKTIVVISILVRIFLGAFGTTLYFQFIEKRIQSNQKPLGCDTKLSFIIFFIFELTTFLYIIYLNRV